MTERVLIVDDDEGVLMLMSSALERSGFETVVEENPIRALQRVDSERIPVVVSDIMMPDMDGLTLLTKIKEKSPETLVIFITANASLDSAVFAIKEGAFAYLRKPFNPSELVVAVKNAFAKVRFLEQNKKFVEELKSAKVYSETILKHLTHAVIATDVEGKIKRMNRATEQLLGYSEAELLTKSVHTIFSQEFIDSGWHYLISEHAVKDFPVSFKKRDGSTVTRLFSGTVMKDDAGKIIGFLGTLQETKLG